MRLSNYKCGSDISWLSVSLNGLFFGSASVLLSNAAFVIVFPLAFILYEVLGLGINFVYLMIAFGFSFPVALNIYTWSHNSEKAVGFWLAFRTALVGGLLASQLCMNLLSLLSKGWGIFIHPSQLIFIVLLGTMGGGSFLLFQKGDKRRYILLGVNLILVVGWQMFFIFWSAYLHFNSFGIAFSTLITSLVYIGYNVSVLFLSRGEKFQYTLRAFMSFMIACSILLGLFFIKWELPSWNSSSSNFGRLRYVAPPKSLVAKPVSYNFGFLMVGLEIETDIEVRNISGNTVRIEEILCENEFANVSINDKVLLPKQSTLLNLKFRGEKVGTYMFSVRLIFDKPDYDELEINYMITVR